MLVLQRYSHCNCKLWQRKGRIEMRAVVFNLSCLAIGTSEEQDVRSGAPHGELFSYLKELTPGRTIPNLDVHAIDADR
jgi:hypothetical protein